MDNLSNIRLKLKSVEGFIVEKNSFSLLIIGSLRKHLPWNLFSRQ